MTALRKACHSRRAAWLLPWAVASSAIWTTPAVAQSASPATLELKRLSVEELMAVEVYSASRRLERIHTSPSALFVITREDLRRSRVTNIPDALRLVPGVQVGQVDANKWAVSMRGFNSREANKLLVLVDGRSIYDPLFSGMLWESQDFLLEDIDRIEVIRGPGGTLWGANAFNGVINIITRHTRDTVGGFASALAGDEETWTVAGRYGWRMGENHYARFYAKSYERDEGFSRDPEPYDASRSTRAGFRWDWGAPEGKRLRVSADVFDATTGIREDPVVVQDVEHRGRNILARWHHPFSDRNELRVQAYYDRVTFGSIGFDQERSTYDLEVQQTVKAGERHTLVWGGGYRRMNDHTRSGGGLSGLVDALPAHRDDELINIFAQDTIALSPQHWNLTVGLKYEETDYADAEWLPNLRLAWTPDERRTWWIAASEAVRVPSRLEADLTFLSTIRIGENFKSEHVRAYELGWRRLVGQTVWFDLATFYNEYDDLRTTEGINIGNGMLGETYGAELAFRWEPLDAWRLDFAYTYTEMDLKLEETSISAPNAPAFTEGLTPRNQASVHSMLDLPANLQFDASIRYVDALPSLQFPSYIQLDVGLSWFPRPHLELSVVGRNLLDSHQPEQVFAFSASGLSTEVERSVYARVRWNFGGFVN